MDICWDFPVLRQYLVQLPRLLLPSAQGRDCSLVFHWDFCDRGKGCVPSQGRQGGDAVIFGGD